MTPHEFILRFPDACADGQAEILQYPTMRDWWMATSRADWMLWCVERMTAERDMYICADLARIWAARSLDAAEIKHTLHECASIVDEATAGAAGAAARAAWAAAREARAAAAARAAWATATATATAAAAAAAEAWARAAWAREAWARAAAEAARVVGAARAANDVRARIECPFPEGEA